MNRQRTRHVALLRPLTAAAALVVASTIALPSAAAEQPSARPSAGAAAAADARHLKDVPQGDVVGQAIAKAKATHQQVAVDSLTTESSETVATPDGHLKLTSHAEQQRTKRNGSWLPLDAALAANPDGTFSPKVSASPLVLSKGGDGPLATMTDADGKKLALAAPFRLPAPTVSGDSLVYPSVAPDTDLKVTATKVGGLSTVLIVKTQAAAANPQLANLHFDVAGDGISVSGDKAGNLVAKSADGKARWASAAPLMWDSSTSSAGARPQAAANTAASGATAHEQSDPAAPGRTARTAQVPATANAKGVDLAPSQDLLAHGTAPYYIDPDFIPVSESGYAWTWVQSAYQTTQNWMQSGSSDSAHPGVGVCGYYAAGGSCPNDIERTFYQFNVSGITGDVIGNATVTLQEYVSADWSCSNTYPLDLYWTSSISGSTSWNNQPSKLSGSLGTDQVGGSGQSACHDNVPFSYTVTNAVQQNANQNNGTITFGVYGDESNANAFKRLTYQPSISVTYDRTPNVPSGNKTAPEPKLVSPSQTNEACDNSPMSSWGWLGAGSDQANAVSLSAIVSSPVQAQLYGQASVWDDSVSGSPNVFWGTTGLTASGNAASVSLPAGTLKDGHDYGWYMYAFDNVPNVPWSSPSTVCHFRVDLTPPTLALGATTYTASQFPPSGSGLASTVYVGQQGYIPFTATDPAPAGGGDTSGVACVIYGFDPQLADGTPLCGSALSGNQIPVTASHWGTNILYARAEDNAGNLSPITSYSFYVPWNPAGNKPVFGDVTGDGVPKIVTPDSAGNLRAFSVPGNPLAPKPVAFLSAKPTNTPPADNGTGSAGDSWANYQTTHRGSLTGGTNVDDLLVHKPGSQNLWWYKNVGNNSGVPGVFDNHTTVTKPDCDPNQTDCTGYVKNWSTTLEIAASGDPTTSQLNAGTFKDLTGLFTIETNSVGDASLWFYPGVSNGVLGTPKRIVGTGMQGWNLISPGDWAQQANQPQPGLWVRNPGSGDLRGYTFTTGTVNVPGPFNSTVAVPTLTGLASNTLIGCGVTAASYPRVGSDGDLTGNGHSTLWGITPSGDVRIWTGSPNSPATSSSCSPGYSWTASSVVLNTSFGADRWQLTGNTSNNGVATDTSTLAPATINGPVSWTTGPNNTASGAANFSGGGYLRTAAPVIDTSQSYTVSAWAYLGSAPSANQTVLAQGGTNHQAFYLWYATDSGSNTWAFTTTGSDNPSTTWNGVLSTIKPNIGSWDHLVATYSVDTHVMTLYVNGKYAGSATNTSPWKAPNGLSIGACANTDGSSYSNLTNGAVTDVRTYPYALTSDQVAAL